MFLLLFALYACLWTAMYAVYFIGAFKFVHPFLIYLIKDKEFADAIFMIFFWFVAGLLVVALGLNLLDDIVLWIDSPWLNSVCKGYVPKN